MKYLLLLLLAGCAAYPECEGPDYGQCVKEERAVKKRMKNQERELLSKECRQAGGVMYCDQRVGQMVCECVDRSSAMGVFR